jgi:xylulokinase
MGAAVTGGVGVGVFGSFDVVSDFLTIEQYVQPIKENVNIYRNHRAILQEAYHGLVDVFSKLAKI